MIHRLGMYYLARQLQDAQDGKAALRQGREILDRDVAADQEKFRPLSGAAAVLAACVSGMALVLWLAN